MKYIDVKYIIKLHERLIESTGGSNGLRDERLLVSALENSKATFDGVDLHPTIEEKCTVICYSLVNNHPFVDGNKRIGVYVMLVLLEYNGIKSNFTQQELVDLGIGIAIGNLHQNDILGWIKIHKV